MNIPYFINLIILLPSCFSIKTYSTYNGTIGGNNSLTKCINGFRKQYSDLEITTSEYIEKEGYPAEEHVIVTDDGYLITLHRIPGPKGAPAVFIQHGLACTSFDWVVSGKNISLAFLLSDHGYDVWLGNIRGSLYSRCHVNYTTLDHSYWDFSFHEMAIYDLPKIITYINELKNDKLFYVGHSMGTTMFYIFSIERPDIASKIKVMYSLAPVAFLDNMEGPLPKVAPLYPLLNIFKSVESRKFLQQSTLWDRLIRYGCNSFTIQKKMCLLVLYAQGSFRSTKIDYNIVPLIYRHNPGGSSLKTIRHYSQIINTKKFQYYDYGTALNEQKYNSTVPPEYDLSKIQVPIGIFWAEFDPFTNSEDVNHLYNLIPKKVFNYKVNQTLFNHYDFLYAVDAPKLVYLPLISAIKSYEIGFNENSSDG